MKWLSLALFLVLTLAGGALAQGLLGEPRFEHLTVNDGLLHSDVEAVVQDWDGFLWIGTNQGINRYDGYDLRNYTLAINPLNGISANRVHALHVSRDGWLWAGSENAGLSWYDADHDRFRSLSETAVPLPYRVVAQQLARADVMAITSDANGRLWVGTEHQGIFVIDFDAPMRVRSLHQVALAENGLTTYPVLSLAATPDGQVWFGTPEAGLRVLTAEPVLPARLVAARAALPVARVPGLHLDCRGDLWIGTDQQLFWVPRQDRLSLSHLAAHPLPQPCRNIRAIHLDTFGQLWVGTDYGLYSWPPGPATGSAPPLQLAKRRLFLPVSGDPSSLQSERLHQIFEDQNQVLWLATPAGGLHKLDLRQKPFEYLQRHFIGQPLLSSNYVNAIYKEESTNLLWVCTHNGFYSYDLITHRYRNYLSSRQPADVKEIDASAVMRAADGTLWFGTRNQGVYTLRRTGGREVLAPLALPHQLLPSVQSLAQDRFGTVWAATSNQGLLRFGPTGQLLPTYQPATGLPTRQFTALLYDQRHDVLWASTRDAGLLKLRVTADSLVLLRQFTYEPTNERSLRVNYVWPLLLDKQGALWFGTLGGGLHRLVADARGQEHVERWAQWLPATDVESILADASGNLWVGGSGLYCFNPATRRYRHYDMTDGLQSNSFKVGAAHRAQDGTLYFGGINGINYFQPSAIQPNPYPPLVRITGLRIANKPVAVGELINGRVLLPKAFTHLQAVTIQAVENDFTIEFVGLNYVASRQFQYAYQLVGYNATWVMAAPGQRAASFTNLPAGTYTFRVKASNGDGRWSASPAALQLTILPPWWRTWWAYLLYGLALASGAFIYRRITLAQQELKNKLALEHFRTEQEKELTSLKLSFFTNLSHELRTPLTLILGPLDSLLAAANRFASQKENILLLHRQTHKLLDLVNQLLDFRKVEAGQVPLQAAPRDAIRFLSDLFSLFKLKAAERNLTYTLVAPPGPVEVYFDASKLEIILTNLLANAFKYTPPGSQIALELTCVGQPGSPAVFKNLRLADNYLEIKVADQGIGIAPAELPRIFDAYYQASQTDTLRRLGTGIGLSLVKQFVERHGGEITVESELTCGTTFTVRLPFGCKHLASSDLSPAPPAKEPSYGVVAPEAVPVSDGLATKVTKLKEGVAGRLLIVEDNDDLRRYLVQLFSTDFDVAEAADGVTGWELVQTLVPDLVICDVMMPGSDGLDLCKKLKQEPKTQHIPIILLTALTAVVHELAGLEIGADEYVSKPFTPKLLRAKVAAILRNRAKLREFYQRQLMLEPTELVIPEADKAFLAKAMEVVEDNLTDPAFTVQALVRNMGMSQSLFYRRIKSTTGQSASEFIRDIRLKRAAQLLTSTQLRVSDVAYQVGLQDLKHFRATFQMLYKLAPSEYAKQHRNGQAAGESTHLLNQLTIENKEF